jgi:prepilin-type N-terminal cleavage/methylation domain-containing protein
MTIATALNQAGQSLIEVLIAVAIVGVILTTIAGGMTYSIKNTAESRYRSLATTLAQDAVEVFRRERSLLGWESFYEIFTGAPSETYCFNTLPATSTQFANVTPGDCTVGFAQVGTEFTREVIVDPAGGQLRVEAVVSWYDGSDQREVRVVQDFQDWR